MLYEQLNLICEQIRYSTIPPTDREKQILLDSTRKLKVVLTNVNRNDECYSSDYYNTHQLIEYLGDRKVYISPGGVRKHICDGVLRSIKKQYFALTQNKMCDYVHLIHVSEAESYYRYLKSKQDSSGSFNTPNAKKMYEEIKKKNAKISRSVA